MFLPIGGVVERLGVFLKMLLHFLLKSIGTKWFRYFEVLRYLFLAVYESKVAIHDTIILFVNSPF